MLNSLSNLNVESAKGVYLYGSKKVLDLSLGNGVNYFGHSNPVITKAVKEQVKKSMMTGCYHDTIEEVYHKLNSIFSYTENRYIFCTTGLEATTKSIRYARASNNKRGVVSLKGGWHGQNEWTLEVGDGISSNDRYHISNLSDMKSLLASDISCFMYEPVQTSNPVLDIELLHDIENYCKRNNIVTICDEIVTGFRYNNNGYHTELGLNPDIICYGKILGGGTPISLITLSDNMYFKTFGDKNKHFSTGGTFSANPISITAMSAVLDIVMNTDYDRLRNKYDNYLHYVKQHLTNHTIKGVGPIWRLFPSVDPKLLIEKNIHISNNGVIHLSPLTKIKHITKFLDSVNELT